MCIRDRRSTVGTAGRLAVVVEARYNVTTLSRRNVGCRHLVPGQVSCFDRAEPPPYDSRGPGRVLRPTRGHVAMSTPTGPAVTGYPTSAGRGAAAGPGRSEPGSSS